MKRQISSLAAIVLAVALLVAIGCSNSKDSGTNNNGGGSRELASGDLNPGQSYTHVFKTAKVLPYYCSYHRASGMTGTITVQAGGTPSKRSFSITGNSLPTFTIDVNDTVTWTNNHNMVHNVRSDN